MVNVKVLIVLFIMFVFIAMKIVKLKVFKCTINDAVTLYQTPYYLNIYSTFNVYNRR